MKKKDTFSTIRFKVQVANRFRNFSNQIAKTHTEALASILDFFEINGITPDEDVKQTITGLRVQLKKRFNATIAIIKNIEKHQTKPTTAMLQRLFEEASNEPEEEFDFGTPELLSENEELTYYRNQYYKMQERNNELKCNLNDLLDKIVIEKRSFGKDYLRLNLTIDEFKNFKNNIEF